MKFDIAIIGGGPGGYVAAIKAAQMGAKAVLFEKEHLGGTCLNKGCIPTKTLLKSAAVYDEIKSSEKYGIKCGTPFADCEAMYNRKESVVIGLRGGISMLLKKNKIEVIKGNAQISDKGIITCGGSNYYADNIIIATGSTPYMPDLKGVEHFKNSDYVLDMRELPKSVIIVGGGIIGVEFAELYSKLGIKVTLIEMLPRLLFGADIDVSRALEKKLKKQGVEIHTSSTVVKATDKSVTYVSQGKEASLECGLMIMAVGRKPSYNEDMAKALGIHTAKGAIVIDAHMRTSCENIYAIGDVNGKSMLAHTAMAEGIAAVKNIMGFQTRMDYTCVPCCVYTSPEIAWVGIASQDAKERTDISVSTFPAAANGKSQAEGNEEGFVKLVAQNGTKRLLGAHLFCGHATEMIAGLATLIKEGATAEHVLKTVYPHPTVNEMVYEAAEMLFGAAIHL